MSYENYIKIIKDYCKIYNDFDKIKNIIINDQSIINNNDKINKIFNNYDNSEIDIMIKKIIINNIIASIFLEDYIPGHITPNNHIAIRINAQNKMNILRLNNMVGFDVTTIIKF